MTRSSPPDGDGGPPASPAFLLIALGRRVREQVETELKAEGMSLRHLSALGHLASSPGLSYSELARRAGITPQSMQATLNALEARGAVERVTEAGRGRTAELRVTAEGDRLRRAARRVVAEVDEGLRAQLGDASTDELTTALRTLLPRPPQVN
ncbi:MarR family winged helix-turn-helix transcriptional regulator [Actinomycetospora atypica]|uniref:MarR family winged helix-turn-helix transcriptional regulator n=1 Tax=Actinomycetospora atypica TaxID=1290095 RepID=A0ABV9YR48_9PSEU